MVPDIDAALQKVAAETSEDLKEDVLVADTPEENEMGEPKSAPIVETVEVEPRQRSLPFVYYASNSKQPWLYTSLPNNNGQFHYFS